ncbi:hypothetical protein T484DRAFT_1789222 [Baffinella frigidus]|nr:hypothetical protein T484DRAFT_1789222 [Cryptophyta sp. CCMP2293]
MEVRIGPEPQQRAAALVLQCAARSFLARELSYDLYAAKEAQKTLPPGKIRPVRAPYLRAEARAVSPSPGTPGSPEVSPSPGTQHRAVLFRKEECERLQKEVARLKGETAFLRGDGSNNAASRDAMDAETDALREEVVRLPFISEDY